MKKWLSVLLAAVMLLAMAGIAGAEFKTPTGTITVGYLQKWEVVDLYQVIEMEFDETKGQYNEVKWSAGIQDWIDSNAEYKGMLPENAPTGNGDYAKNFYSDMYQYIMGNSNRFKPVTLEMVEAKGAIDFKNQKAGSYLIAVHGGARKHQPYLVSLKPEEEDGEWTLTSIPEVVNANEKVKELEINKAVSAETVGVQDVVQFTIKAEVPKYSEAAIKGGAKYWIKDTMDAGFELIGDLEVKGDDQTLTNTEEKKYYTLQKNANTENSKKYTAFQLDFVYGNIREYDTITVTYQAKVNKNIAVGATDNDNKAEFEWGSSTTNVYTYGLEVEKYDGRNQDTKLDDVVFNLKDEKDNVLYFEKNDDTYHLILMPEGELEKVQAAKLITANGGKIKIDGLNAGSYSLVETVPAQGYNVLKAPISVNLEAKKGDPNLAVNNGTTVGAYYQVSVENNKGMGIPSTGGMGTTIFMVAGISVMACAVAALMLVLKRQKKNEG